MVAFAEPIERHGPDRIPEGIEPPSALVGEHMSLFRRVLLYTTKLAEMRRFYEGALGFKVVSSVDAGFVLEVGASLLEFRTAEMPSPPLYHYALGIPENKVEEALVWAETRIPAVQNPSTGSPIYDFEFWNAHAFYFLDPEGNIGEFIARHAMRNATSKPFEIGQVEHINELGVVTADVAEVARTLGERLDLKPFPDPEAALGGDFQALGTEQGLFVVVKQGRVWLGSDKTASAFPAEAELSIGEEAFALVDTKLKVS
jgi:catechol 2,3-dioxygenase-like lactoylglutathione lyase family enzyme